MTPKISRKPYVMTATILIAVYCLFLAGCSTPRYGCPAHRNYIGKTILRWHTDKRGLTSVQWRDNTTGKEWGLDYATKEQLREEGLIH